MASLYLMKRGATYYFRRAIPASLRPSFSGATEFIHSLHTKDREEAKRLRSLAASKTDSLLEKARRQISKPGSHSTEVVGSCEAECDYSQPKWANNVAKVADFSQWQDLIQRWAVERKPSNKTIDMHTSNARTFFGIVPKNLTDVTEIDVEFFKDKFLELGQTQANTRCVLSRLKTMFSFARSKKIIPSNPALDIKIIVKDSIPREPFDATDLDTIFSQSIFHSEAQPIGSVNCAHFWIPVLALCHGAREEEIAQLRVCDVRARTYYDTSGEKCSWTFLILTRDKVDGLKIKTDSSVRQVPIHPFVIKLRFLEYVAWLRDRGEKWLFPDIEPGAYGRRSADFGEWFSTFLRSDCGITNRAKVFYSFRHTFKDLARDSNIPEGIQRQFMGHAKGDVADRYGKGFSDRVLVEAMKSLRIPGITINGVKSFPL